MNKFRKLLITYYEASHYAVFSSPMPLFPPHFQVQTLPSNTFSPISSLKNENRIKDECDIRYMNVKLFLGFCGSLMKDN